MTTLTLGSYPAKKCARRTHNEHVPGDAVVLDVSADILALRERGRAFEAEIVEEIRRCHGASPDVVILDDASPDAAVEAMDRGVAVIVGARLPDVNARSGAPDVLVRHDGGYLPVDIKNHQTITASSRGKAASQPGVEVSSLTEPARRLRYSGYTNRANSWRDDVMQLAHYTRMLQDLGWHAGPVAAGIIGTSDLAALIGSGLGITWYDLDAEEIETYSSSSPARRRKRSPLQRYDHEFAFRQRVAAAARSGGELARPYRIAECATCEWFDHCAQVVGAEDASFATETGHLTVRQWQYLYTRYGDGGRLSVEQLARVDPGGIAEEFVEQSVSTRSPLDRLSATIRRADMRARGVDIEELDGSTPEVPAADIEIDFDIEWDTEDRIYQWGLRIREGQDETTARYEPIVSFEPLDEDAEAVLADRFARRIAALRTEADRRGKSVRVFHWSHPEISRTGRFPAVRSALDGITEDLYGWFNTHYFCRTSSSLKKVAGLFGFQWDVDDAGGLASMHWIDVARAGGADAEAARQWCLRYNRCDVAAQAVIRDALRGRRFAVRS
ncbi:ribonuclease H-like domain-containing protein [Mycobacterium sp. 1274756.6]|uniref:ribonuclease H-like domain-containing protein n=1 Tax=Mycobacterium sp. 1274756.6 TaxID=1834076 RepID=UPI0007FD076C|nr:ribonuclease H-like domain-containing protein [Mycobacterium sp. 1274756.6]OBJ72573.1 recombinase RecB [Mycobacterium sp. 1274756.6]